MPRSKLRGNKQVIKGCRFSTRLRDGAAVFNGYEHTEHFGVKKEFKFADWVLDSFGADPILTSPSEPGRSRHYYARRTDSTEFGKQGFLRDSKRLPRSAELYVIDQPGQTAYFQKTYGVAYNISLQLRTCFYKTSDVPASTTPDNINFTAPIVCFDWESSWIYNFKTQKFENPFGIVPACK